MEEELKKILDKVTNYAKESNRFLDEHKGITIGELGAHNLVEKAKLIEDLRKLDKEIHLSANKEFLCKLINHLDFGKSDADVYISSKDIDKHYDGPIKTNIIDPELQKKLIDAKYKELETPESAKKFIEKIDKMWKNFVGPEGLDKDCSSSDHEHNYMTPNNRNLPNALSPKSTRGFTVGEA